MQTIRYMRWLRVWVLWAIAGTALLMSSCRDENLLTGNYLPESENSVFSETSSQPLNGGEVSEAGKGAASYANDNQAYIYTGIRKHYDMPEIADFIFGEGYITEQFKDELSEGIDYSIYEKEGSQLISINDVTFFYNLYHVSECYSEIVETGRQGMHVQEAVLKNKFPLQADEQDGYEEVKAVCDDLAGTIAFPYDQCTGYYIDYDYLQNNMIAAGPACYQKYMENGGGGETYEHIWNQDETAFLFIYSKKSFAGEELCSLAYENELIIIYAPLYGICYVNCASSQDYLSKKAIETVSGEEAYR